MGFVVTIVGLGVIGASLGLALKDSPLVEELIGVDPQDHVGKEAVALGAVRRTEKLEAGIENADVVFLCCPLERLEEVIKQAAPVLKPGAVVTDVGSVKQVVMEWFRRWLPGGVYGIGGHPMAGSERTGLAGADRYLFENAVYVLVLPPGTPSGPFETLSQLISCTGAKIITMDAAQHDRLVATASHLPHLAAVALVNQAGKAPEALGLAGGGFRDTTRVASSNPAMWEEIFMFNREAVLDQLDGFIGELNRLRGYIAAADRQRLRQELQAAQALRESVPRGARGALPSACEIITVVPDRPGVIGYLGTVLGEGGINIVDIEILRVREGDGGTIRLGVPSVEDGEKAVKLLRDQGIKAWMR